MYNQFEGEPSIKNIKDTIYWYASDYCDVFVADRILDQVDANRSFAADIIRQSDLTDLRYLYSFGDISVTVSFVLPDIYWNWTSL